jgi:cellulose synthase operon protein C
VRRCADLATEMKRYTDAQRLLTKVDKKIPRDSRDQPAATDRCALAELEDLQGQCDVGQNRLDDAERFFKKALEHDAGRVSCYDRLARLRRSELRRNEAADGTVEKMVAKNPEAGRSYLYRWRYKREFSPPADARDLKKALELAPNDPEVLLSAAAESELKPDTAAARVYFEKGFELDPKNLALALGLAGLESRERHDDRAEKVLRRAKSANPCVAVILTLAETLIGQGKIDGKDQAGDFIARLRYLGLGDSFVPYLEARVLFQQKKWAEAIPNMENTRAVLRTDPRITTQLNLMLAECYDRLDSTEQRLEALRQVADRDRGPESARIARAEALARSGKRAGPRAGARRIRRLGG